MRTKLNLDSSTSRQISDKFSMSGMPLSSMPLEWLDAGSWRLPSGKALAEFALQAGFLAPLLFNVEQFGRVQRGVQRGVQGDVQGGVQGGVQGESSDDRAMSSRTKNYGKGSGQ
jgi:hypothetical protein